MYEVDYTLGGTDPAKTLTSITFNKTDTGTTNSVGIFAISGSVLNSPTAGQTYPNSLGITAGGSATLAVAPSTSGAASFSSLALGAGSTLNITGGGTYATTANFAGEAGNASNQWTLNHNTSSTNGISFSNTTTLVTTTAAGSEADSAWYNTPVYIGGNWTASYSFYATAQGADGTVFVLQSDPAALAAYGEAGGSKGYAEGGAVAGIGSSIGFEIEIYSGTSSTGGVNLWENGVDGTVTSLTGPEPRLAEPSATQELDINLSYTAGSLAVTVYQPSLGDTYATTSYTTTYAVNLPAQLGGNIAYLGFTGGTGGVDTQQVVTGFNFNASTPGTAADSYGATFKTTTLSGADTINVANNSTGTGVLTLGALNDGGTPATLNLNFTGSGKVIVNAAATSLVAGSQINVNSGTLQSTNASALGANIPLTVSSSAAFTGIGTVTAHQ